VRRPEGALSLPPVGSPLEQLRAGTIDARAYAEMKIQDATGHLGHGAHVTEIQSMLRAQLQTDPFLRDLFQAATGQPMPDLGE
jgi:hypothetical protein